MWLLCSSVKQPKVGEHRFSCPPISEISRVQTMKLFVDVDVLVYFRATGKGWKMRMNVALKERLKGHAI